MNYEERPWGNYQIIHIDQNCQVKKLVVNPGKRLSLQSHKYRAEHWFVVSGRGLAQVDSESIPLAPGDSVDIPVLTKHRISCEGEEALVFIEVQTGTSFDEMDIVRFEDDFGRS
jgi:mannose-6-phosphate isomerase-like protein (cupin superfamily)